MSKKKKRAMYLVSAAYDERLSRIQHFIEKQLFVTAEQMAVQLECDERTVRRAIKTLIERGHPIEYDQKIKRFRYTKKMGPLNPVLVTEDEVRALHMIEGATSLLERTSYDKEFAATLSKLYKSLDKNMSSRLKGWRDVVSFHDSAESMVEPRIFNLLAFAIAHRRRIRIIYRKIGKKSKAEERLIDPYHLAKVDGNWYLFAYDHKRKDDRTFFISRRLVDIEFSDETFKRKEFSLKERLRHSFGIRTGKTLFNLKIHFTEHVSDYIREKKWPCQQGLVEFEDGSVELRLLTSDLVEPHRWIMTWGGQAVVKEPSQLRDMVLESSYDIIAAHVADPVEFVRKMHEKRTLSS